MITFLKPEEADRRLLFCDNFRYLIRSGPVNATELSKRTGISTHILNSYARGKTFPSDEVIKQLAEGLGVTVDDLFDETYAPWKFGGNIEY